MLRCPLPCTSCVRSCCKLMGRGGDHPVEHLDALHYSHTHTHHTIVTPIHHTSHTHTPHNSHTHTHHTSHTPTHTTQQSHPHPHAGHTHTHHTTVTPTPTTQQSHPHPHASHTHSHHTTVTPTPTCRSHSHPRRSHPHPPHNSHTHTHMSVTPTPTSVTPTFALASLPHQPPEELPTLVTPVRRGIGVNLEMMASHQVVTYTCTNSKQWSKGVRVCVGDCAQEGTKMYPKKARAKPVCVRKCECVLVWLSSWKHAHTYLSILYVYTV